ncbi:hypothetical protein CB1_000568014 [Camelus ferus]|nr:hypothetical protein CB1_000568014 [Camelus ferus]
MTPYGFGTVRVDNASPFLGGFYTQYVLPRRRSKKHSSQGEKRKRRQRWPEDAGVLLLDGFTKNREGEESQCGEDTDRRWVRESLETTLDLLTLSADDKGVFQGVGCFGIWILKSHLEAFAYRSQPGNVVLWFQKLSSDSFDNPNNDLNSVYSDGITQEAEILPR